MKKGKVLAALTLALCMIGNLTTSVFAAEPEAEVPVSESSVFTEEFTMHLMIQLFATWKGFRLEKTR